MTMTRAAVTGAAAMGMTRRDMEEAIRGLTPRDFVKSMTAHHDHRAWMDVYHGRFGTFVIYIKFAGDAASGFVCTSFKER